MFSKAVILDKRVSDKIVIACYDTTSQLEKGICMTTSTALHSNKIFLKNRLSMNVVVMNVSICYITAKKKRVSHRMGTPAKNARSFYSKGTNASFCYTDM